MTLTQVIEKLVEKIENTAKVTVKTAWISPNDTIPIITLIQSGGGVEVLASSNHVLSVYEFQLDIWARSAKERDELYEKIVEALLKNWIVNYKAYGWWSLSFFRIFDVEEEGVFRKTMLVVVKEVT